MKLTNQLLVIELKVLLVESDKNESIKLPIVFIHDLYEIKDK